MAKNGQNRSGKIALAGILTALGATVMFLENIVPTGKLGFYVLAGFLLSVVIMECGLSYGWISFTVVSLLSFLLVPEKTAVIPYVLFFGIYALAKSHIERMNKVIPEWILKFAFFNLSLYFLWNIAVNILQLIPQDFFNAIPLFVIILILQVVFFIFDWIFSFWIQYYLKRIQPKIQSNRFVR